MRGDAAATDRAIEASCEEQDQATSYVFQSWAGDGQAKRGGLYHNESYSTPPALTLYQNRRNNYQASRQGSCESRVIIEMTERGAVG